MALLLCGILWGYGAYEGYIWVATSGAFLFGILMGLDVSLDPYDKEPE